MFLQLQAELREYNPRAEEGAGELVTSALGLTFKVTPQHVSTGLKLECTASIGSVYWQSFQEKIPVAPRETPAAMSGNWWKGSVSKASYAACNNHLALGKSWTKREGSRLKANYCFSGSYRSAPRLRPPAAILKLPPSHTTE